MAFIGCTALTNITFPSSLEIIGKAAFQNCTTITTVDFSNTLLNFIDEYAFFDCTSLTTLKLPPAMFANENNASIGFCAFWRCTSLTNIYLPTNAAALPKNYEKHTSFRDCSSDGTIWYPAGKQNIANDFKNEFNGLTNWTLKQIS
jgi:hypothetical protein